jgi:hypothetical protein
MITVNHSACLLLGGSFEPTYILTITALPVQLQPTTNKRNAALIQQFLSESISVTPDRGILKFLPIPEDSLAMGGTTILGDIERLERRQAEENGGTMRAATKSSRRSAMSKAKSSIQLSRNASKANLDVSAAITPPLPGDGPLDSGVAVNEKGIGSIIPPVDSKISHKKSEPLLSKFSNHKSSSYVQIPLPISKEKPATTQIKPKKSFFGAFRR